MPKHENSFLKKYSGILIFMLVMALVPFIVGLMEGSGPAAVWANTGSVSKFVEGLGIEIFVLAIFALSYDLIFGITGLLSLGHSMFFSVAAYLTGIGLKTLGFPFWQVLLLVFAASILQALLFSLVLPRVKGVTFALVTLGMASVFHIIVTSSDLIKITGADVGLQGIPAPLGLHAVNDRLRIYVIALILLVMVYVFFRNFIDAPAGRVCIAIRENEGRAQMLGYNTAIFKILVLLISSFTASLAGVIHAIYQPIISPTVADMGYTVTALLIVLIGGVGTLSGSIVGAFVMHLSGYLLRRYVGDSANFILGAVYIVFVLFVPYGIVGTLKLRSLQTKAGLKRLKELFVPTKAE